MILQFQKKVPLAEDFFVSQGRFLPLLILSPLQIFLDLPCQTGRKTDNSLMKGPKNLVIHPRFIVESVHIAFGHDLHQVLIPLIVFRQKHQVVIPVLTADCLPVKPGTWSHIDLTADDGFHSCLPGCPVKINDPVHGSMVCNGHTVHSQFLSPGCQFLDLAGAVQQAVFRMDMQMCKCHSCPP